MPKHNEHYDIVLANGRVIDPVSQFPCTVAGRG
jgi:hypothetical protein